MQAELLETMRELAEGKAHPVGTFVKRKSGTFRKMKDGTWGRVQKTRVKVARRIKNVGSWKKKGKDSFRKTSRGGWAKSVKFNPDAKPKKKLKRRAK